MHARATITAWAGTLAMVVATGLVPAAAAAPPEAVAREVSHLLGRVANSGCEFYRNGIWYKGNLGEVHLREKYDWLTMRNLVDTTDDFIGRAATRSSLTGLVYKVRCNGRDPVPSAQWLNEELLQFRAGLR